MDLRSHLKLLGEGSGSGESLEFRNIRPRDLRLKLNVERVGRPLRGSLSYNIINGELVRKIDHHFSEILP